MNLNLLATLFGGKDSNALRTSLLWNVRTRMAEPRDMYGALWAYYQANAVYETLREQFVVSTLGNESLRGIRNPAFRATEFYVAHLFPGSLPDALPIVPAETVPDGDALTAAIQKVWSWGNFNASKQVASRYHAGLGDMFIKVAATEAGDRVFHEVLDPWVVEDYETDSRGFITWARLDVVRWDKDDERWWTHTEIWSKDEQRARIWRTDGDAYGRDIAQLDAQTDEIPFSELGIDFVPLVHAPFRDTGGKRGDACFLPVLDKVDELNRIVTRLHQMGFRNMRNVWATTREMRDANERPLAPVNVGAQMQATIDAREAATNQNGHRNGSSVAAQEELFVDLPGATDLKSLVPDLDYDALLNAANATLSEIENDLPEIRYFRLAEIGTDLSGRAIRYMLAPAIKRAEEARGNAESALARADMMACTMGKALGLDGFAELGEFDRGELDHTFREREIIPLNGFEKAEEKRAQGQAVQAFQAAGLPLSFILTDTMDLTEEEAREIVNMAADEQEAALQRQASLIEGESEGGSDDAP